VRELSQIVSNLISHSAESREPFLLGTLHYRGIFKVAMDGDRVARKNRAAFLGVVANRQNVIESLAGEFVNALGMLAGNVNVHLAHNGNCLRTHLARVGPSAKDLEAASRVVTQQPFGHLAAG